MNKPVKIVSYNYLLVLDKYNTFYVDIIYLEKDKFKNVIVTVRFI